MVLNQVIPIRHSPFNLTTLNLGKEKQHGVNFFAIMFIIPSLFLIDLTFIQGAGKSSLANSFLGWDVTVNDPLPFPVGHGVQVEFAFICFHNLI